MPAACTSRQGTCVQGNELSATGGGDPGLAGDRSHRLGTVTGDDLGLHTLLAEVGEGLSSVGADLLSEDHDPCGLEVIGKPRIILSRSRPPGRSRSGQGHDTHSLRSDLTSTVQH